MLEDTNKGKLTSIIPFPQQNYGPIIFLFAAMVVDIFKTVNQHVQKDDERRGA
jgi:hypothetical protein